MCDFIRAQMRKRRTITVIGMLLVVTAISSCELDRSGLPAEAEAATTFDVIPPMICPGESVTASWDVPVHEECGEGSPCSNVNSLISSPINLIAPPVVWNEVSGSRTVTPPDDMSFRLEAIVCNERGCLSEPTIKTGYVNVLHEEEGVLQAVFEGVCVGARAGHDPFQLDISPCSQVVAVCNTSPEAVHVETSSYGRFEMRADLLPGDCTTAFNDIPFPGTLLYARPLFGLDPSSYCGALETSRPPGSLVLDIHIGCNLGRDSCDLGIASEAVVSIPCGDGICSADEEESLICQEDCDEPESDSSLHVLPEEITPMPTETHPSPPTAPIARFTKNANCRRGPGTAYGVVTSLLKGQEVQLEGRNADNSWWWALLPESTGHCWVADSVVEVIGPPMLDLPLIAAPPLPTKPSQYTPQPPKPLTPIPPTPQPSPPTSPNKLGILKHVCNAVEYSVTLSWKDNAVNEDGYRVYRGGQLIATLKVNATKYKDNPPGGGPFTYSIEAFNAAGTSGRPSVYEEGCLY